MSVQPRRIRLKPWLLTQVNSGRYPGLQWISPDHRLFQIPWKHATRHTPAAADEEHTIFKAWAVETGKYQDGVDEPDPAKWKANLRCALNKSREFQLKYDGTKETPVQPYKVYEVCDQGGNADAADDDDEEMPNLMELSLNPRPSDPPLFSCVPHADVRPFRLSSDGTFSPVTPGLPMTPDGQVQCEGGCGQSFVSLPPPAESAPPCPAPMEASSIHDVHNQTHCKYDLLSSVPLTDLELKFQYRGRPMGSLTVSNPQGCRLFFGLLEPTPDQVDLLGPVSLQQVRFPGTGELQSHKQKFYTDALLDAMERGLILELWQQDLYAVRLCQCKVFWSGPGVPPHAGPNPLEREKKIKVFSLNDFLQGLILFHRGEAAAPPPFDLFFCFGEDWPDNKPRDKKLIIVQVVPVVARILTEMFSGELSWSTDSIRLQISNPDVKDQTVEQFKELQRLLQNQHIQGPWAAAGP